MESLDFPVAASVAAPIKFAWISSSRGFSQEREAVRGFSCAIVVATLAGAIALSGTVSGTEAPQTLAEAQRRAVERSRQKSAQDAAVAASRELALAAGQLPDPEFEHGVGLPAAYALGLGVPFLVAALIVDRAVRLLGRLRGIGAALQIGGGLVLVALGVAMITGRLSALSIWLLDAVPALGRLG